MRFLKSSDKEETMKETITISLSALPDELIFSQSSPLRLLADTLSGFDFPKMNVECAPDNGGRSTYMKKCELTSRVITLGFEVTDMRLWREVRDKISRMMTLGRVITLRTVFLGRSRRCELLPYREPEYSFESFSDRAKVKLSFVGRSNYFTEDVTYKGSIPHGRAACTFPLTVLKSGALMSLSGPKNAAQIYNPGDTDCPIKFELYADGSVTDPSVMLGERKITLHCVMSAGDSLTVKSGCSWHLVTPYGGTYTGVDRTSRFFSLPPGTSTVVLNAAKGAGMLRGSFEFEPRYLGM